MIIKKNQVPAERAERESFGVTDTVRLSAAGGLSQYGAYVQTLLPGARSSNNHWHENEDEFLYVLSGEVMAVLDSGPFFHGTKAQLQVGELLTAGFRSNYRDNVVMNHIYFTALAKGAGLAAEIAKGEGKPRVYIVEPTGEFENDPNVTDRKFPGNPTRSYRSRQPLKVVGELESWEPYDPAFVQQLRRRIETGMGEIIND